jgi:hypothetical protein
MAQSAYRIRDESLPGYTFLVVRGGLLEITTLRADAEAARRRFSIGGVSVFGAGDATGVEVLARSRMVRFDVLTLVTFGVLRAAGLETVPTFKAPHYTIMLPNLEADLRRLLACENVIWVNPFYVAPEVPL